MPLYNTQKAIERTHFFPSNPTKRERERGSKSKETKETESSKKIEGDEDLFQKIEGKWVCMLYFVHVIIN